MEEGFDDRKAWLELPNDPATATVSNDIAIACRHSLAFGSPGEG